MKVATLIDTIRGVMTELEKSDKVQCCYSSVPEGNTLQSGYLQGFVLEACLDYIDMNAFH